jgi:hypothetical protein
VAWCQVGTVGVGITGASDYLGSSQQEAMTTVACAFLPVLHVRRKQYRYRYWTSAFLCRKAWTRESTHASARDDGFLEFQGCGEKESFNLLIGIHDWR